MHRVLRRVTYPAVRHAGMACTRAPGTSCPASIIRPRWVDEQRTVLYAAHERSLGSRFQNRVIPAPEQVPLQAQLQAPCVRGRKVLSGVGSDLAVQSFVAHNQTRFGLETQRPRVKVCTADKDKIIIDDEILRMQGEVLLRNRWQDVSHKALSVDPQFV